MIEFSNKCTKCGKIIKPGIASYSFHAFGKELCWDCQNLERFQLKVKRTISLGVDESLRKGLVFGKSTDSFRRPLSRKEQNAI